MRADSYYNENDPFVAQWLRNLIAAGHIAPGDVDERSIAEVQPDDLRGYTQCHFFAGIGVWSHALRQAGWPDDRPVWTGSCPCQPFSAAGKGDEFGDERHLWPVWFRLIRECRPIAVFGEQVASKDALTWLDHVSTDLEGEGYTVGAVDSCAAGFGAPHIRQRLYWVADAGIEGLEGHQRHGDDRDGTDQARPIAEAGPTNGRWADAEWLPCRDGKARPTLGRIAYVADGLACGLDIGGATAEAEKEIDDAAVDKTRPLEALCGLQFHNEAEAIQRSLGVVPEFQSSQILRPEVHGERANEGGCDERQSQQDQGAETRESELRIVRSEAEDSARPSQGWQPTQQRPLEFADSVRLLPSAIAFAELEQDNRTAQELRALLESSHEGRALLDAQHTKSEVWRSTSDEDKARLHLRLVQGGFVVVPVSPLSTNKAVSRVGILRGAGNAICAPQAAEFVKAYMEIKP